MICPGGVALTPGRLQAALVLPVSGTESAPHKSNAGQARDPRVVQVGEMLLWPGPR